MACRGFGVLRNFQAVIEPPETDREVSFPLASPTPVSGLAQPLADVSRVVNWPASGS